MNIPFDNLIGLAKGPLVEFRPNVWLHQDCLSSFNQLKEEAEKNGYDIQIVSSFRSFYRQKEIWQMKALGEKTLLDKRGNPLDFKQLKPQDIVEAILRWSAFPGASRHHWGCDFDVIDGNAIADPNYQIQLTPSEVEAGGVFADFHQWLDEIIPYDLSFGFFRPYDEDLGGVSPEKWHLSYAPLSQNYQKSFTFEVFKKLLEINELKDLAYLEIIKEKKEDIFERFIQNTTPAPQSL